MKQTIISRRESPLLAYAISKLNPEVFSHPVWIRFGTLEPSNVSTQIGDLLSAAEKLERDDPGGACQILLVCTVYQNHAGQQYSALRTVQRALALAEHAGLAREAIWALWGASSVCIQQGSYDQTECSLLDLQAALNIQKEWMLSDLVEVLRNSLWQSASISPAHQYGSPPDRTFCDLLTFTFDWLQNWGVPLQISEFGPGTISGTLRRHATKRSGLLSSFFSAQHWQDCWHSFLLAIRGELRLQWVENNAHSEKEVLASSGSISKNPHMHPPDLNVDVQSLEEAPLLDRSVVLQPSKEDRPKATSRKSKPNTKLAEEHSGPRFERAPATTPVAVHMLGSFSTTIGDLTLKLPASRGLSILKYILLHHKQAISREMLMDIFWSDAEPETARNNLNVTIYSLRKSLRSITVLPLIRYEDGAYGLEHNLEVWLDVEEFDRCVKAGQHFEARQQLSAALSEYEAAVSLYQGDFLEQTPYEEWAILDRERLRVAYLDTIDRLSQIYFRQEHYAACITVCQRILSYDRCREDAHCLLMHCYSRQGQHPLAVSQYQNCVRALRDELEVEPALETTRLYERIRRRERV